MINCTNLKCKYMSGENKCNCKNIILSYWNVATRNMGNKDFLECKSFKIDKEYQRLENNIKKLLDKENI